MNNNIQSSYYLFPPLIKIPKLQRLESVYSYCIWMSVIITACSLSSPPKKKKKNSNLLHQSSWFSWISATLHLWSQPIASIIQDTRNWPNQLGLSLSCKLLFKNLLDFLPWNILWLPSGFFDFSFCLCFPAFKPFLEASIHASNFYQTID
jgi:hypothetical protein